MVVVMFLNSQNYLNQFQYVFVPYIIDLSI